MGADGTGSVLARDQFAVTQLVHRVKVIDVVEDEFDIVVLASRTQVLNAVPAQERIVRSIAPPGGDLLNQRTAWLVAGLEQVSGQPPAAQPIFLPELATAFPCQQNDVVVRRDQPPRLRPHVSEAGGVRDSP